MRSLDIIQGVAAIVAAIGLLILFFYNAWYAVIACVLFGICQRLYRAWSRRQNAKAIEAAAQWREKL